MPRARIPAGLWPGGVADRTFARYPFLEIGWGDRKFYTAPKPNALMAFDAVFSPGPSVLHVVGLRRPLDQALSWSALVPERCTKQEFENLCRALGDSFERDSRGQAHPIEVGLYGETSRFYPALGRYSLLNTCDNWTARMMRAGGLPAETNGPRTWSAGAIISQARRLAVRPNE